MVGLIVKMDDVGLSLAQRESGAAQRIGRGLVRGMPRLLSVLSTVGIAAMLWVGGHILLVGIDELGWHAMHDVVHHLEEAVAGVAGIGGLLAWLVNTLASALLGLVVGAVIVAVLHVLPKRKKHEEPAASDELLRRRPPPGVVEPGTLTLRSRGCRVAARLGLPAWVMTRHAEPRWARRVCRPTINGRDSPCPLTTRLPT